MNKGSFICRVDSSEIVDYDETDKLNDNDIDGVIMQLRYQYKTDQKLIVDDTASSHSEKKDFFKHENFGALCVLISHCMWGFNGFYTKLIQRTYPDYFQTVPFLFIRGLMIMTISFSVAYITKHHVLRPHELTHKMYFFIRTNLNFFSMCFFTVGLWYLRVSTAQIISTLNPIMVMILSTFILKEDFHFRYAVGVASCTLGSVIIILNEKKTSPSTTVNDNKSTFNTGTLIGVVCGLISVCMGGFITLANKILAKNKISVITQMVYVSISTVGYSFIYVIFTGGLKWCFGYVFLCLFHGVLFYTANIIFNRGIQLIDLNKSVTISYVKIVEVFILGNIFLGEPIFFTDIVGACLIVSYMLYNVLKPVKKK